MQSKTAAQLEKKFACNFELLSSDLYFKNIGIAVSGGVDSIALLLLMHKYAADKNISLTIFTVNHNLRPEAAKEVKYVTALCVKLGVACVSLSWDHQGNFTNLSARARQGRYDLISKSCQDLDTLTLLTAHHFDDSLETFLLKKGRQSGVMALSSGDLHFHNNIRILRPLFDISKYELTDYVQAQDITWIEDSSNLSNEYLRNVVRKKIAANDENYKVYLSDELAQINENVVDLNRKLIEALSLAVKIYKYGFAVIDIPTIIAHDYEIQLRLIIHVLNSVSGAAISCRASTVSKIIKYMHDSKSFAKTMHSCIVKKVGFKLLVTREFGKKTPLDVDANKVCIWDGRFRMNLKNLHGEKARIASLSMEDYKEIKHKINLDPLKKLSFNHHKVILFTLPIIKVLEKIVSIPHISYYDGWACEENIDYLYCPGFTSRFIHFY